MEMLRGHVWPATRGAGAAIAMALVLTACGGGGADGAGGDAGRGGKSGAAAGSKAAGSTGTITIADRTFTFTPKVCMTDGVDTLVSGVGSEDGKESVYVDLDSTGPNEGGLSIDLGADAMVNSSERTIRYDPGNVVVTASGTSITMTATFIDENDQRHDGSLKVDCR